MNNRFIIYSILTILLGCAQPILAQPIIVCKDCKTTSLKQAIVLAKNYDTIIVKKGTYKEYNIDIDISALTIEQPEEKDYINSLPHIHEFIFEHNHQIQNIYNNIIFQLKVVIEVHRTLMNNNYDLKQHANTVRFV